MTYSHYNYRECLVTAGERKSIRRPSHIFGFMNDRVTKGVVTAVPTPLTFRTDVRSVKKQLVYETQDTVQGRSV